MKTKDLKKRIEEIFFTEYGFVSMVDQIYQLIQEEKKELVEEIKRNWVNIIMNTPITVETSQKNLQFDDYLDQLLEEK